ncbi:MAG TPA: hypothetical protein VIF14_07145 [Alphaproteobacteria bacterium]
MPPPASAPGRSCAGCTMCCRIFGIPELEKPRHQWCSHCDIGVGCKIYDQRPASCREFVCGYLVDGGVPEHWKPSKSRMVLTSEDNGRRLVIHVDTSRPDAWRKAPFHAEIKRMAVAAARSRGQVIVWQGKNAIAVLPDREKFLGPVAPGQIIVTTESDVPGGGDLDVEVVDARAATPKARG